MGRKKFGFYTKLWSSWFCIHHTNFHLFNDYYQIHLPTTILPLIDEKCSSATSLTIHTCLAFFIFPSNTNIVLQPGADYPEPPYVLYPWVNPFRRRIIFRTGFPAKIHCFRERPHIAVVRKKNGVGRGKLANKFSPCSTTVFLYILSIPSFTIEGSWLLVKTVNIWL